jgi:hypothetical protein
MTDPIRANDKNTLLRLAANAEDVQCLELLLDRHRWIVEDEVSHCFGRPPWFDSAVAAVLVEIVRRAAKYAPQAYEATQWIRRQARRAGQRLEQTIAVEHAKNGFIEFSSGANSLESLVTCLLERCGSPYWDNVRPRKPLRRPARGAFCGSSSLGGSNVDG